MVYFATCRWRPAAPGSHRCSGLVRGAGATVQTMQRDTTVCRDVWSLGRHSVLLAGYHEWGGGPSTKVATVAYRLADANGLLATGGLREKPRVEARVCDTERSGSHQERCGLGGLTAHRWCRSLRRRRGVHRWSWSFRPCNCNAKDGIRSC